MRKRFISLLIIAMMHTTLLAMLIFNSNTTISQTVIGEVHLTGVNVWIASGSPYYIEGNVTVDYGADLTIEAGVEVLFNGPYSLYVEGDLMAVGNALDPIKFTSNDTFNWNRIQINSTGYAKIRYCNITYGEYGLFLEHSSGNDIQNNNISNNLNQGITLNSSLDNIIKNNIITGNSDGLGLYESSYNNTILNNDIFDNVNYGVILSKSPDKEDIVGNNVEGNDISYNHEGLRFYKSSNNTILNNNVWNNNFRGIYVFLSKSNVMRYNRILSNDGDGIYISQSSDNVMSNNNISLNGDNGGSGINLTSTAQDNRIFHNTLIDNACQASDGTNDSNQWDDGYPNGGNYWSDYIGVDEKRGEQQDVPGGDGIGDTNYSIDLDSIDNYPLMSKTRDVAPYLIALISPYNNSVIKPGTIIDLHILVQDFDEVNYSVKPGSNISLSKPFDINTSNASVWSEGNNRLDVYVIDNNGNVNSSWFFFILDSTKPVIELNSPSNNSLIKAGEIINISIIEPNIKSVSNSTNNGSEQPLLFPYDFDTSSWADGNYSIEILAEDLAGNVNSTLYVFVLDSTPPTILLNFPVNNSYIKPGTVINFSILDEHLDASPVNYFVNGQGPQTLTTPYDITTDTWDDRNYVIEVDASDILGNFNSRSYNITIDSVPPLVILNNPMNNSVVRSGVPLNFSVFDIAPINFRYLLEGENVHHLYPPYDINTSTWNDGIYTVNVNVTDSAGNLNLSWFNFTIDSYEPIITLKSPSNNSYIRSGTELVFDVFDITLAFANYSVDGGEYQNLLPSLKIDTSDWSDGTHNIDIFAVDLIGNSASVSFVFNLDNTPPKVVSTRPRNRDDAVSIHTSIKISFSEEMDIASVVYALSISPSVNFTVDLSADNLSLIITPIPNLTDNTTYTIVINTSAKDLAGNSLKEKYVFGFTTGRGKKEDWTWLFFVAILAIILVVIFLIVLISRRRKRLPEKEKIEEEDEFEEKTGEIAKEQKMEEELEKGGLEEELEEGGLKEKLGDEETEASEEIEGEEGKEAEAKKTGK